MPMPCSPGEGAAQGQGLVEDGVDGRFHPVPFLLVALVGEDGGMEVAVPGVAEGADGQVDISG